MAKGKHNWKPKVEQAAKELQRTEELTTLQVEEYKDVIDQVASRGAVERPLTDAEFLAKVLEVYKVKPEELVERLGAGSVTHIRNILAGRSVLTYPFKPILEKYITRSRKVIPRTTTEPSK